jgi:urease accessory protein
MATTGAPDPLPTRLLLLLDGRSPAGAQSHSGGMEAAVTAGLVGDLGDVHDFCLGLLHTAGAVAAAFAAAACRGWSEGCSPSEWRSLDDELSARTISAARRAASRSLGSGLRRLLRATAPDADLSTPWHACQAPAPHHPLVLGAACALTGGTPRIASRAAALASVTVPASAAVRLLGLDPYAVHSLTAGLHADIEAIGDWCGEVRAISRLPAGSAPGLDLLAEIHANQEGRLFAS